MTNKIEDVFQQFDADGSDAIEVDELDALLQMLGFDTTNDNVLVALAQLKTADPSKITLSELTTWWNAPAVKTAFQNHSEPSGNLRALFDRFDEDGDGEIDVEEFRSLIDAAGGVPDEDVIAVFLQSVDVDHDGVMTFETFRTWWAQLQTS